MYAPFFGLTSDPFRLSASGHACYEHTAYRRARSYMQYALSQREGILLLTGHPGTGKTSLISQFIRDSAESTMAIAEIVCSRLDSDDLLRMVAVRFGVPAENMPKSLLLTGLEKRLRDLETRGRRAVLVVDEAQGMTSEALEEVRGLTNLQSNGEPLLQIFLVGQTALMERVREPGLEQLHQRIIAACHLDALTEEETRAYVEHCLTESGWSGVPGIDSGIFGPLHRESMGVPRRINLIASRLLLRGMVEQKRELGVSDIEAVLEDLRLEGLLLNEERTNATTESL